MNWTAKSPSELLMYCVKRIEGELSDGRKSVGTGYICAVAKPDGAAIPILITNKHVIDQVHHLRIFMHTAADADIPVPDGGRTFLESPGLLTVKIDHPDPKVDLCALLLGPMVNMWKQTNPGKTVFYKVLTTDLIFSDDQIEQLDVSESVLMVGCPNGIWDEHNGFPLFRRGTTASHPALNYQGRSEFVVDIGVYSGSSGSPILLVDSGLMRTTKEDNTFSPLSRFGLLGTLWGGPRINETGEVKIAPVPTSASVTVETGVRMHLGFAVKASETRHLLDLVIKKFGSISGTEIVHVETLVPPTSEAIYRLTGQRIVLPQSG